MNFSRKKPLSNSCQFSPKRKYSFECISNLDNYFNTLNHI
ncbi:hypothetical protein VFA_001076 [Vibrio furnissii CIP 102972]|nr:hypothetical protein vfu_A01465 [Vibrio furnissii NCTC 11218]EEX41242.1 hypothetical protein VFA_001076 [Vibrio furnissii CIP 102972]SUP45916.1 Uncharacterised protein [Vibrio furnissii]